MTLGFSWVLVMYVSQGFSAILVQGFFGVGNTACAKLASLHSVFEVRFLASFFFLAQVGFRPLMWLVIMHGVVLSRDSQTGGTIRLETALTKVDIGLQ